MANEHQSEGASAPSLDPIAYDEIARHFFQNFLELRDRIRSGADPTTLEREIVAERRKSQEFKRLLGEAASRNEALELVMEDMERQAAAMRKQLNEALFEVARLKGIHGDRRLEGTGTPFMDRLSESSKKELAKLMTEKPSTNPNRREERE